MLIADSSFVDPTLELDIYADNIAVGGDIMDYLNNELTKRWESGTPSSAGITGAGNLNSDSEPQTRTTTARSCPNGLIRPFNATLSQEYRSLAMAHFREGTIRVLVCTDAAGMVSTALLLRSSIANVSLFVQMVLGLQHTGHRHCSTMEAPRFHIFLCSKSWTRSASTWSYRVGCTPRREVCI